jgi:hypothetical protein
MNEEKFREELYKLLDEHDKAMSVVTLINAKNQIKASTVNEIVKLARKCKITTKDVMKKWIDEGGNPI